MVLNRRDNIVCKHNGLFYSLLLLLLSILSDRTVLKWSISTRTYTHPSCLESAFQQLPITIGIGQCIQAMMVGHQCVLVYIYLLDLIIAHWCLFVLSFWSVSHFMFNSKCIKCKVKERRGKNVLGQKAKSKEIREEMNRTNTHDDDNRARNNRNKVQYNFNVVRSSAEFFFFLSFDESNEI